MNGIYFINTPERLFEKLVRDFDSFYGQPSEDGVFEVLFSLYHLREWICPRGYNSYKTKQETNRTREERLHALLHDMIEYQIVRGLCNCAKHFYPSDAEPKTEVLEGLRVGLGKVGDSLGITHFIVDDREIRDVFWAVYSVYFAHFRQSPEK